MLKNKKIFVCCLVALMPFFVRGVSDILYNKTQIDQTGYTANYKIFTDYNYVHPKTFEVYYPDLSDAKPAQHFQKTTDLANRGVEYLRHDGTGFVRKYGTRTWRNMNPGALRPGPFATKMGACGTAGGFAIFPTEEIGMIALKALLRTESYVNLTMYEAIKRYAPSCDNNDPLRYKTHLSQITGIDAKRTIGDLSDEELDKVAETIKFLEGWKHGTETNFGLMFTTLKRNSNQYNS